MNQNYTFTPFAYFHINLFLCINSVAKIPSPPNFDSLRNPLYKTQYKLKLQTTIMRKDEQILVQSMITSVHI